MNRPIRLLVVDDESEFRRSWQEYFQDRGYDVVAAQNANEALQQLRSGGFDVAILDIWIPPGLDGISVAERVAAEGIDTGLIMVTGHGGKDDAVRALRTGVVEDWFEKNKLDLDVLRARVDEAAQVIPPEELRRLMSVLGSDKE